MWEAISTYRFSGRISTEAEAIRRLLSAGLVAESKTKEGANDAR
jgi:hypothetical protein